VPGRNFLDDRIGDTLAGGDTTGRAQNLPARGSLEVVKACGEPAVGDNRGTMSSADRLAADTPPGFPRLAAAPRRVDDGGPAPARFHPLVFRRAVEGAF